MVRRIAGLLLYAAVVTGPVPAFADDAALCSDTGNPKAVEACTRILAKPDLSQDQRADILVDRANALHQKGEYARAVADYDEVIRIHPRNDAAYNNRGNIRDDAGDKDGAIADYGEALRIDPQNELALYNRCSVWSDKGEADRAIADCTRAIEINPKSRDAHHNRAGAWSIKGQHDKALSDYDQALEFDPEYAKSHTGRGYVLSVKRDYAGAIAAYGKAIRLEPRNATAVYGRARAHLYSGAQAKALADMRRAAELEPTDLYVALWFDLVAKRNGKPGRLAAAAAAAKADTDWPAPAVALFLGKSTLDAMFAAVDDPDPFQRTSNVCDAQFYGGLWSLQRNDRPEAIRMLRVAAEICPAHVVEWHAAREELRLIEEPAPATSPRKEPSRRAR